MTEIEFTLPKNTNSIASSDLTLEAALEFIRAPHNSNNTIEGKPETSTLPVDLKPIILPLILRVSLDRLRNIFGPRISDNADALFD